MKNYNLGDLYKDDRLARLTSELNDANSKQEYNRAEQIEDDICRLFDHYQKENQPIKTTTASGVTEYRLNGERHREDGPAYDDGEGRTEWYLHGKQHREDGPAVDDADGSKVWILNGELHREGGPAVEQPNPYTNDVKMVEYYVHGKLHRQDGPALDDGDGQREWFLDGKRHCETGPAIECAVNGKEWWLNGEEVNGPEDVVDYHLAQNVFCFYDKDNDSLNFK